MSRGLKMKQFDKGLIALFFVCCLITILGSSCPKYLSIDVETEKEKVNIQVENPDK